MGNFHGVMIGRGAMNTPCMLWDVDHTVYGEDAPKQATRRSLLDGYREYLEETYPQGDENRTVGSVHLAVKPALGLFAGLRGNRAFRSTLDAVTRNKTKRSEGPAFCLEEAMRAVEDANPGLLDEPLAATPAFNPSERAKQLELQKQQRLVEINAGGKEANRERKRKALLEIDETKTGKSSEKHAKVEHAEINNDKES